MRVYKDISNELSLNNCFLIWKNKNFFCNILDISGNIWTIAIDADFTVEGECQLIINYNNERLVFPCYVDTVPTDKLFISSCIKRCIISTSLSEEAEINYIKKVRNIEKQQYHWNKRKEERYDIKFDIEKIQFSSPQQQLISRQETLPCFIENISYGGAKLITYESRYEINDKIVINYSFTNPPEIIDVPSYIRHIISRPLNENNGDRLISLCVEYDHAPLSFQNRMIKFVERINKEKEDVKENK